MPDKPDDLTFAELRLANLLADRAGNPIEMKTGDLAGALAGMVIHADLIAAVNGVDLGAAIKKQFAQSMSLLPASSPLSQILHDWDE